MIPAQYQLLRKIGAWGLLIALGAGVTWWGMSPRVALEGQRADGVQTQLIEAQQLIEQQAGLLAQQQKTLGDLAEIERRMKQLGQTISRNQAEQSAALEELKRNDQAVAEYLSAGVPADLGRLYARPETTDPGAYRSSHGVQPSTVPPAGPISTSRQ